MRVGELHVLPIADGTFVARPRYFGTDVPDDAHAELFRHGGAVWLPIGCFLIPTGDRLVLVDAGLGPDMEELPHGMHLVGGQLLTGLRAAGTTPGDVTDVVCTHLHSDHVGWLFDHAEQPVFPNAAIWFGAGDWHHFVTGRGFMADRVRRGFTAQQGERLRLVETDTTIARGVTALLSPGHTPGHLCVVVSSGQQRALLLGDAITCPVQLDEPTWHSLADVDPALARRTRARLWRELESANVLGVGAHFPELQFGRVLAGSAPRRWMI